MSCSICNGLPGCPVCAMDDEMRPCPECDGEAFTAYFNTNGDEITRKAWEVLPEKYRGQDICTTCEGTGKIEYKPEYEYNY